MHGLGFGSKNVFCLLNIFFNWTYLKEEQKTTVLPLLPYF